MADEDRLLRIGNFARKARVTVRTVRYYDLEGLLVPRRRSLAGFRLYDEQDLERLRKILALKELGLPLDNVREILETERANLKEVFARKKATLSADIERLKRIENAVQEAERAAPAEGEIDWEAIFGIANATRKERQMTTYSLSEEQFRTATTSILYPKGRPKWFRYRVVIGVIIIAALIVVPLLLRQYAGASLGVALGILNLSFVLKNRKAKTRVQARTRRLTNVPYKIEVTDTSLQVEYDRSTLHLPYENLHITKRGTDFYSVMHELGLQLFVPVSALDESQHQILQRHLSQGPFDWEARLESS